MSLVITCDTPQALIETDNVGVDSKSTKANGNIPYE